MSASPIFTSWKPAGATIVEADQFCYYGNGQSSSLGVGASVSCAAGTFSASGTNSVSTNSVPDFAIQCNKSFNHFQTWSEVGRFYEQNSCPGLDRYLIMDNQWNAGTNNYHPPGAPGATHCTPSIRMTTSPNDHHGIDFRHRVRRTCLRIQRDCPNRVYGDSVDPFSASAKTANCAG